MKYKTSIPKKINDDITIALNDAKKKEIVLLREKKTSIKNLTIKLKRPLNFSALSYYDNRKASKKVFCGVYLFIQL